MQKKLFVTYFIVIAVVIIFAVSSFWQKGYRMIEKQNQEINQAHVKILADELEELEITSTSDLKDFALKKAKKYNVRITILNDEGVILADSAVKEIGRMENHSKRPEIKQALQEGKGSATRYSETTGEEYEYNALSYESMGEIYVLRLAVPLSGMTKLKVTIISFVIQSLFWGTILAVILAIFFSRKITAPLNQLTDMAKDISEGNYDQEIRITEENQIGQLAIAFNKMAKSLRIQRDQLTSRNIELETILSSMNSAVVAVNSQYEILFCNDSFKTMFQETKNITNSSLFEIVRNSSLTELIDRVKENGSCLVSEFEINKQETKFLRATGALLQGENRRSSGVLLVIDDVSNLKKLETMRKDFMSNVTHELKTPLTSIRGFVDTLKNGAIHDEKVAMRFLNIIDVEAEKLCSLIQDVLVLSEIESQQEIQKSQCDVKAILLDVIEFVSSKCKKEVEIVQEISDNVGIFMGNEFQLREIFTNLIDNAIKYTEEGSIHIMCCQHNKELVFEVKDTGIGIGKQHLDRLFERFYRVDKGRSRKQGGTGLGLSIVKHIVERYNGTIQVESNLGEGTTFTVKLPYAN